MPKQIHYTSLYDYIQPVDPSPDVNPLAGESTWLNISTGEIFFCIDNTVGENYWQGNLGTFVSGDPYLDSVVVAIPFTDGYTQEGSNPASVVENVSFTAGNPTLFGHPVQSFGGTAVASRCISAFNPALNFGTAGDFTIEWWARYPAGHSAYQSQESFMTNGRQNTGSSYRGYDIHPFDGATLSLRFENLQSTGNHYFYGYPGIALTRDVWHHFAVQRVSGIMTWYYDGVDVSDTPNKSAMNGINVGQPNSYTTLWGCGGSLASTYDWFPRVFMSEVRITTVGRYSANFTPKSWLNPKASI